MISFIIIGKNIENTISKCIQSVIKFTVYNDIKEYEIIYVDSNSNDNTIKAANNFPIKILSIKGDANAAIGRNTGSRFALHNILFFIDGDMELIDNIDFYNTIYDKINNKLYYPIINGCLIEKYYDKEFNYLYSIPEILPKEPYFKNKIGGLMVIDKSIRKSIGEMDERLIRNQDIDFSLRATTKGYPALKDNKYWAIHHTTRYTEISRIKYFIFSKALFSTGLLLRKHIFNKTYIKEYRVSIFYMLIFMLLLITIVTNVLFGLIILLIYLLIHLLRALRSAKNKKEVLNIFLYKSLYYPYMLYGLLFYYPTHPKYKITIIK